MMLGTFRNYVCTKGGGSTLYLFINFLSNCPIITTILTLILIREDKNIFCSKLGSAIQSAPLANSYALLTYKRVGSGSFTSGIAYIGQVCGPKSKRVNINLYWGDSIRTSEVRRKGSITFFFKSESKLPSYLMPCRLLLTR